ncbi:MAG TPA: fatty acyl-AMP ligase, partial [Thermoanaerobaculia bacterium]|nr:fatty acyl-AMP ligase [Thermoanaerobaculia bacterium]
MSEPVVRVHAASAPTPLEVLSARAAAHPEQEAFRFLAEGDQATSQTYGELWRRARALGAWLALHGARDERALLLYPPGLDFVTAFFGCLAGGAVAVPSYPPNLNRPQQRLRSIAENARPRFVLTTTAILGRAEALAAQVPELAAARWLATDELPPGLEDEWQDPGIDPDSLAFLQYTSGSTAAPKGVMVSHRNLGVNEEMIREAFEQSERSVVVGWLPLFHDMGLIGSVLQPLYVGGRCVLMSPVSFLQRPARWLRAISEHRATTSGGPDFAYDLCVRRVTAEQKASLDLSSWTVAFNGAEPVRAETLDRFAEAFAECGFRREAFYPCYGLAEATLFVSGGERRLPPRIRAFDAAALEEHRAVPAEPEEPGARRLVSNGRSWLDGQVVIADPETAARRPDRQVGEIWVAGPSVAHGYWNRPEVTEVTFRGFLAGTGEGPFLRTGDLGFLEDGELFVTGRIKDLIILRGRNHYPQDIERSAEQSHGALRPGCGAAFSVPGESEERLVVVQEVAAHALARTDLAEVATAIRREVAGRHDVSPWEVVLIRAGTIPKTSSGKIQRSACRAAWRAGELTVLWTSGAPVVSGPETET